jgi:hypothetical protein
MNPRPTGGKAHGRGRRVVRKRAITHLGIPKSEYQVYPVKIFDGKGTLKRIIPVEALINRPIPESDYAEHTGEEQPPQYQN